MKKLAYSILALAAILSVSCSKEKEAPVAAPASEGMYRVSIKAAIEPGTRTSYENDKTFSWKAGDVIQALTLSPDQDYLRVAELTAESDGTETIFTGEVEEGYTLYSIAFYTAADSYITFDDEGEIYVNMPSFTYIDGDNTQYYTAQSANPLSNLPLTGVQNEDGTYIFFTAAGAAKFSFEDIPEGAAYFAVEYSTNYLSGQFALDENGVLNMDNARKGSYERDGQTYNYASRYIVYHFDRSEDGTGSIYMPLPVGEIPAGATVSFYDSELENVLYSRTIRSAIPVERNKVTEIASFSATSNVEWEDMGTGAYYDLLPFYFMNEDVNTFVGVEFYRDPATPGVYRIENPYPLAAADREYTIPESYELPEFLTFTVLKDNTVIYDDIHTGYVDPEDDPKVYGDWFGGCPANWGEDNSYNFVAKYHEDGTPDLMVLSPLYLYQNLSSGGYYYAYSRDTWKNMWVTVYFPGCDLENQYDLYCSVELTEIADDSPAQPYANVEVDLGADFAGGHVVVATSKAAAEEMFAAGLGAEVTESGTVLAPFPADAPSGEYFAFLKTIPAEGFTENCALVFDSGDEFVYYRSDEDLGLTFDDIVGSYTGNNYYRTSSTGWTSAPTDLTLSVEESDDPLAGFDLMFPSLCPEIAQGIAGRLGTATAVPVYGTFDTEHGVITIPAGQVAYTVKPRVGTTYNLTTGDVYGGDIVLYLREANTLRNKTNIGFFQGENLMGNTNADTYFYRNGTTNAPRKATGRKSYGFRPIELGLEKNIGHFEGLVRPAERIEFVGTRVRESVAR